MEQLPREVREARQPGESFWELEAKVEVHEAGASLGAAGTAEPEGQGRAGRGTARDTGAGTQGACQTRRTQGLAPAELRSHKAFCRQQVCFIWPVAARTSYIFAVFLALRRRIPGHCY